MIELKTPITDDDINQLKAGDVIAISGQILTARDQAHKRKMMIMGNQNTRWLL